MNKDNYELKPEVFEQIVTVLNESRAHAVEYQNLKLIGNISKLGRRLHIIAKAKQISRKPTMKKQFLDWLAFRHPGIYWLFWSDIIDNQQ